MPWRMIALVALLKLALVGVLFPRDPEVFVSSDTRTYVRPALSLLVHGEYLQAPDRLAIPELNRTPGYPALIAAVYWLVGPRIWALLVVNVFLSAATAALLFALARRLFDAPSAVAAAVLYSIEPGTFHYSLVALTETSFVFLLILAAYAVVRTLEGASRPLVFSFLGGAALGAATLVRPITYYLLPLVPLLLFVASLRKRLGIARAAAISLAFFVPCAVSVGAWQLRNQRVSGSATISPVQVVNLYFCRAAAVEADVEGSTVPDVQERFGWREFLYRFGYAETEQAVFGKERYVDVHPVTSRLSQVELARLWGREAFRILSRHPFVVLKEFGIGLLWLFLSPPVINWGYQLGLFHASPEFVRAAVSGQGPTMLALLFRGRHVFVLALAALSTVFLLALYAAAARGVTSSEVSRRRFSHLFLLGVLAYFVLVTAAPEAIDDRYRVPLMPFLCLYAGAGLLDWRRASRPVPEPS